MNVGTIEAVLRLRDEMTAQLQKAAKSLEDVGEKATKAGMTLSAGFTLPIVAAGGASVAAFAGFERVMNQVAAVSADGAQHFDALEAAAIEWGAKTQYSAKEAGDAMFELGKAGLTSRQMIDAIGPTLELATAGQMSLAEAASLSANVMSTFGLSAGEMSHANDIMARAAASATLDVTDLRETLKYVGPIAQATGNDLSFVSAAASMMATAGIKGSQAGTALKGALSDLLNPTKKTREGLAELGFTMKEITSGKLELPDVLDRLKESTDRAALGMKIFGEYSGPGMVAIAKEGGAALSSLAEEFRKTDGDAKRMSDATMKGLAGGLEKMKGGIETAGIALGKVLAPAVQAVAEKISALADFFTNKVLPAFNNLPKPVQVMIGVFVALVAALGPILLAVGAAVTGFTALIPVFTAVGTVVAFLLSPIGLVVAAVAALTAVWVFFGDDIKRIVSGTYTAVKTWLWDKLSPVLTPLIALVKALADMWVANYRLTVAVFEKIVGAVSSMVSAIVAWVVNKLEPVWRPVIETVAFLADVFVAVKDRVVEVVAMIYNGIKSWLLDKFTAVVDAIRGKVEAVTGFFTGMYSKITGKAYDAPLVSVSTSLGAVATQAAAIVPPVTQAASVLATLSGAATGTGKSTKGAADGVDKLGDEIKSLAATLSGADLIAEITKLDKAVKSLGGSAKVSAFQKKKLGEQLSEMASQGATLTPELHKIWLEYQKLNPAIRVVTAGHRDFLDVLSLVPSHALKAVTGLKPLTGAIPVTPIITSINTITKAVNNIPLSVPPVKRAVGDLVGVFANGFQQMAQIAQGSMSKVLGAVGQIFSAVNTAKQMTAQVGNAKGNTKNEAIGGDWGVASVLLSKHADGAQKAAAAIAGAGAVAGAAMEIWSSSTHNASKANAALSGAMSGAKAGAMFGPWGAAIGAAAGALLGFIGASKAARNAVVDFAKSFDTAAKGSGFDELRQKMLVLGAEGERMWIALTQGKGSVADKKAIMSQIEKALADAAEKAKDLADKIKSVGDELADLKSRAEPTWKDMIASAEKFGISIDALGPAFQQQRLTEQATEIWHAFDTLKRGGADVGAVLSGMSDEASKFVQESLKFGTTVPENMRPMLQGMIDAGTLIDANGEKITDLSGIKFGPPVKSQWEIIADSIKDLSKVLTDLAAQLRGDVVASVGDVAGALRGLPTHMDFEIRPNFGMGRPGGYSGDDSDTPGFAGGTHGRYLNFGQETMARLHGRERIMTEAEQRGQGIGTIVMKVGEREFGRIALRAMSEAAGEYGVGIG